MGGMRECGREAQKGGNICIHTADSRCMAETNTTLESNYIPIKKIVKKKKKKEGKKDTIKGIVFQDAAYVLNQQPFYGSTFPGHKIHASRNQGEEARVALLTISSNSPLGSVVLPVPETLRFSGLEALVPGINGIASII